MWDWAIRRGRPRIWLDESRLKWLRDKVKGKSVDEIKALAGPSTEGLALTYAITGDEGSGRAAILKALSDRQQLKWICVTPRAIAYDWCYPLLTFDEKRRMCDMLVRDARREMSNRRTWRSFSYLLYMHGAELGLASIAVFHDDPLAREGLEFLKAQYADALGMFEGLFADGEWPEGFDYNRVGTYVAFRFLWALKTAAGVDLMANSAHMRNTCMYIIYGAKPDGLVCPADNTDYPFLSDRDREALLLMTAEYRDEYAQYFLNHCGAKLFLPTRYNRWRDLLWYDASLPEKPFDSLPKSRLFRGEGLVIARSGWGWDSQTRRLPASWVTFRCGRYYGDQAHYDNNHFDIYYRGELTLDSGRYDDDWGMERSGDQVQRSQFFNYYRRSIAHNTILVHDPDEKMDMGVLNDGGQKELLYVGGVRNAPEDYDRGANSPDGGANDWVRNPGRWDTGEMLAYAGNDVFTYACGDATRSYSERKLKRFVRQWLFVQPDIVIVFDRVVSTRPELKKTWLLHSVKEPRMLSENGPFELSYGGGRLVCVPVLPDLLQITKVGGPGNEFLVGGIRYGCGPNASSGRRTELHYGEIPGAWRVAECPSVPALEDYILNVMLMTDKGSNAVPVVRLDAPDGGDAFVAEISLPGARSVTLSFAKGETPAASLKIVDRDRVVFDDRLPVRIVLEEGRL